MDLSPLSKAIPSWGAPTLEDFDLSSVQEGRPLRGNSKRQFVHFYNRMVTEMHAVEVKKDPKTGSETPTKFAAVQVEKVFVKIVTPGDKNEVDQPADDWHKREYWNHYKAFREGRAAPLGTPLDDVPFINAGMALELRYLGCHTLEQFADSSDELCNRIPSGWELREFARAKVSADQANRPSEDARILRGELENSKAVIAQMQAEMKQLQEAVLLNSSGQVIQSAEMPSKGKK